MSAGARRPGRPRPRRACGATSAPRSAGGRATPRRTRARSRGRARRGRRRRRRRSRRSPRRCRREQGQEASRSVRSRFIARLDAAPATVQRPACAAVPSDTAPHRASPQCSCGVSPGETRSATSGRSTVSWTGGRKGAGWVAWWGRVGYRRQREPGWRGSSHSSTSARTPNLRRPAHGLLPRHLRLHPRRQEPPHGPGPLPRGARRGGRDGQGRSSPASRSGARTRTTRTRTRSSRTLHPLSRGRARSSSASSPPTRTTPSSTAPAASAAALPARARRPRARTSSSSARATASRSGTASAGPAYNAELVSDVRDDPQPAVSHAGLT